MSTTTAAVAVLLTLMTRSLSTATSSWVEHRGGQGENAWQRVRVECQRYQQDRMTTQKDAALLYSTALDTLGQRIMIITLGREGFEWQGPVYIPAEEGLA